MVTVHDEREIEIPVDSLSGFGSKTMGAVFAIVVNVNVSFVHDAPSVTFTQTVYSVE